MINSANKYQISDIFNADNILRYVVPKYQREYTWTKDNWEAFLDDIWESEDSYFVGSIICINNTKDALDPFLELVDGQQRLTTLSLLFTAIYSVLNKFSKDDENLMYEIQSLKWKIVNKDGKHPKLEPSYQNNNYNDYLSILSDLKIIDFDGDIKNKGNRKMYKGYRYFFNRLEGLSRDELVSLLRKINRTLLVKIEVSTHSDAFILFESLNNRGVPLSAIDLIKNSFLSQIERQQIMSIDKAFDLWNSKIIENLTDLVVQERFLRQYYNAFKVLDKIKVPGKPKAIRSTVISIFEELISKDTSFLFDDLMEKASLYGRLLQPTKSDDEFINTIKKSLIDLIHVKAAPSYTFLLYLFSFHLDKGVDFFRDIIDLLVKYFIRRNITDFPNTRNLDQIFIDIIEKIHQDGSRLNMDYLVKYFTDEERFSTDEEFEKYLRGDLYDINVDATRFILSKIEEVGRTKENDVDFRKRDQKGKLVWTIEHIFPEGRNIPKDWIDMIAGGDKEMAEQIQNDYVHKLGNLTLTGFNQSLSNFDFSKKRDRKDSQGRYIGYRNNLFLNDGLIKTNTWRKEDIIERGERLIKIALDIFKVS